MLVKILLSASLLSLCFCQQFPQIAQIPFLGDVISSILQISPRDLANALANLTFNEGRIEDVKFLQYEDVPKKNGNVTNWKTIDSTSSVNISRPTVVYVQGWFAPPTSNVVTELAEEYRKKNRDYNIITVDWTTFSTKNYLNAAFRTRTAGTAIGDLISKSMGDDVDLLHNVHIVGHSLGAHVAGFAGKKVLEKTGRAIGRITGLDPAGPLFEIPVTLPESDRLARHDAEMVEAIHTNARLLGFSGQIGDADFYVALGGPIQPDCQTLNIEKSVYCSHMRALQYFIRSINNKIYMGISCPNSSSYQNKKCEKNPKAEMGENTSPMARGSYFMEPVNDFSNIAADEFLSDNPGGFE